VGADATALAADIERHLNTTTSVAA
jgi:hypothetical protein